MNVFSKTGGTESMYLNDYMEAIKGIQTHLVGKSIPNHFTYVGELLGGKNPSAKMVGLVSFNGLCC